MAALTHSIAKEKDRAEAEIKVYTRLKERQVEPFCMPEISKPFHQSTKLSKEMVRLTMPFYNRHEPGHDKVQTSFVELVRLLQRLHAAGVTYSDLKPEHVRETATGEIILIDFDQSILDGAGDGGFSCGYCSLERLLGHPANMLHDLEGACWVALNWLKPRGRPETPPLHHFKDKVVAAVGRMLDVCSSCLDSDLISWLKQRLVLIWSTLLDCGTDRTLRDSLCNRLCDYSFKFTPDMAVTYLKDWQLRHLSVVKRRAPPRTTTGQLVEQFVRKESRTLFPKFDGHFSDEEFNVVFEAKDQKTTFTEFDMQVLLSADRNPVPITTIRNPYKLLAGGEYLVTEVWTSIKSEEAILNKFNILPPGHRPLHVLLYFGHLLFVGGGIAFGSKYQIREQTKAEKKAILDEFKLLESASLLGKLISHPRLSDLAVLCAAGRLHFFALESLSIAALASISSQTISGLQQVVVLARHTRELAEAQEAE
jgi:hypothetical protein